MNFFKGFVLLFAHPVCMYVCVCVCVCAVNVQLSLDETYADVSPVRSDVNMTTAFVYVHTHTHHWTHVGISYKTMVFLLI